MALRWLLDMGVSKAVAVWLRAQGYDAVHLHELGLNRLDDSDIFRKADTENRVVLTCDLDFSEVTAITQAAKPSGVVFRLQNMRAAHVIARLTRVISDVGEALSDGCIVSVEETRIRVRRMPIS